MIELLAGDGMNLILLPKADCSQLAMSWLLTWSSTSTWNTGRRFSARSAAVRPMMICGISLVRLSLSRTRTRFRSELSEMP